MNIKPGSIVSHSGSLAWGVGKVLDVALSNATIQFSDGVIRKIASSHYTILQPADPASFVLSSDSCAATDKPRTSPKRVQKIKPPSLSAVKRTAFSSDEDED